MYAACRARGPSAVSAIAACGAHGARDAEVGDQRVPVCEQDVLRLDVAMDDALRVRVVQGLGRPRARSERVVERELLLALEPLPQRLAVHVRHDVVEQAAGFARIDAAAGCADG